MDALALSPRRLPSPRRRPAPSPSPAACVDVQWTFLPPQPLPHALHHPHQSTGTHSHAERRLCDLFENGRTREELQTEQLRLHRHKDESDLRGQRVLLDLLGETQRKAMLDKIMADMEAMALVPVGRVGPNRHKTARAAPVPSATTRRSSMVHVTKQRADELAALLPQRRLSALGADQDREEDDEEDEEDGDESSEWTATAAMTAEEKTAEDDGDKGYQEEDGGVDLPELRAIRERHRRRMQDKLLSTDSARANITKTLRPQETRIRWQQSAHVRLALDLPPALAESARTSDYGYYDCSGDSDPTSTDPLSDLFPLSEESVREQQQYRRMKQRSTSPHKSPTSTETSQPWSPGRNSASPRVQRIHKAHYGSWYTPRDQWWPQHQTEQDTLAELFPNEPRAPLAAERHYCVSRDQTEDDGGGSRSQKAAAAAFPQPDHPDRWPSVLREPIRTTTTAVASPRTANHSSNVPSSSSTGSSSTSPSVHTIGVSSPRARAALTSSSSVRNPGTRAVGLHHRIPGGLPVDPIAQRASELRQEIPHAYIAREYRDYLLAKGIRVPNYLQY